VVSIARRSARPAAASSAVAPTLLAASPRAAEDEQWRAACTGRFRSDDLPGDHYTLFTEPALSRIVAEIERALAH
jgi:thioesterase domain-containing protein